MMPRSRDRMARLCGLDSSRPQSCPRVSSLLPSLKQWRAAALYPSSIISLSHSPRTLHSHPDFLPGVASLLGMCLGWGHLSLCSSSITASINTGNAVLFPRHDCTRLCWMRHAPSRKRPLNPLSKLTAPIPAPGKAKTWLPRRETLQFVGFSKNVGGQ